MRRPTTKRYGNPLLGGVQATGDSNSVRASWKPLREAGAVARTMLVAAAAQLWNVDPAACRAQARRGAAPADGTARSPMASWPPQRCPHAAFRTAWRSRSRRTSSSSAPPPSVSTRRTRSTATAVYGIDVRLPGMKIATLAQLARCSAASVKRVDDAAARAVNGVRQIVRLDDAVAVVADHMGAAKKGLAALAIEWDDGPNAEARHRRRSCDQLEQATLGAGRGGAERRRCRQGDGGRRARGSRRSTSCRSWRTPPWSR